MPTISRYSFTDDVGDGLTGDAWDSSLIDDAFYDPIDALIVSTLALVPKLASNNTFTGYQQLIQEGAGYARIGFLRTTGSAGAAYGGLEWYDVNAAGVMALHSNITIGGTYWEFNAWNGSAWVNKAAVDTSGNITLVGAIVVGSPTGGNKGAGTVNATAVYDDNTLLTDFVFEDDYVLPSIDDMRAFFEVEKHLPTIPGRDAWDREGKFSLGQLANAIWETVEVQARYIAELHGRLSRLEAAAA